MIYVIAFLIIYFLSFAACYFFLRRMWKNDGIILDGSDVFISLCPVVNIIGSFMLGYILIQKHINWKKITIKLFGEKNEQAQL